MKTMSVSAAQKKLTDVIRFLKEGPVLLLRKGQPCAALVGLDERFDREAFSLGRNKRLRRLLDEACRKTRESGGIPFAEIVAEVQAQQNHEKGQPARPRKGNAKT